MASRKLTFEDVRKIANSFAGVEESTLYGSPALKVKGKLVAVVPTHKSAEPDSVAVSIDFDGRAELIEAAPETASSSSRSSRAEPSPSRMAASSAP